MSAETELANMLSRAAASASALFGSASTQTSAAIAVMEQDVVFPEPPPKFQEQGVWTPSSVAPKTEPETPFPALPGWTDPHAYSLQGIDPIDDQSAAPEFPKTLLPDFAYAKLGPMTPFAFSTPTISTSVALPTTPELTSSFLPNRIGLNQLSYEDLQLQSPEFAQITTNISFPDDLFARSFSEFQTDIFSGIGSLPGIDELLADEVGPDIKSILPLMIDIIHKQLDDKYVNPLKVAGIQERFLSRVQEETIRVDDTLAETSGWELPTAARQALLATAQQFITASFSDAQAQLDSRLAEVNLAFFELCGDLAGKLSRTMQQLKIKELELVLEAHRLSLAYAKQSISALLAQYEAKEFTQYEVSFKKAEAELGIFESELKLAYTRFDLAKAKLEIEQAKQQQDGHNLKIFQAEVENARMDVDLYEVQISARRTELELQKATFELFELQVKAFTSEISAYEALVGAHVAEIEGDAAKIDGQMAKVSVFSAEVKAFRQRINALQQQMAYKSERNEAVLNQHKTVLKLALVPVERKLLENQYTLSKYRVSADEAIKIAMQSNKEARLEQDFNAAKQNGLFEVYKNVQDQGKSIVDYELDRLKALAQIHSTGASVLSSMGAGAMSAANGIASVIFEEG